MISKQKKFKQAVERNDYKMVSLLLRSHEVNPAENNNEALITATHNLNLFKFFLNLNFKYEKNEHYSLIKSFLMVQKFGKPNDNIFLDLIIEKHGFSFNNFIKFLEGTKPKIEYFMSFIKKYDIEKSYLSNLEDCFQYMTEEDIKCYSIEANLNSF